MFLEYPAFLVGWSYILTYQLSASAQVAGWSDSIVTLIELIPNYNATRWIVQAPFAWSGMGNNFYVTGGVINLPAIFITVAIIALLLLGIRETAYVNFVLVVFKIIVLLIFIFAGCVYVKRANYVPFVPSNQGIRE